MVKENLSPSSLPMPNQRPLSIDEELWQMAEERAQEILCIVQASIVSEVNRKDVIDYVRRLIRVYYGAEVFPFGSVPLKTYLPDGDIDFTVLCHEIADEDIAQAVCRILGSQENSEYQVKNIQHIPAQVQVVKCTVKNIAVDISFNQMGGIYAVRFLEHVDELVGRNHLLKCSIILVKAWCYYESRILGAHHGLLSTYAVEILILYIINRFHSSLCGPLEVLYRFLNYYSTFDWEKNYVSIDGPKALSSLPEIVETPECDRAEFLLSKEFLRSYRDMCSVQARAQTTIHRFPTKHLNILDPLRSDNNLGRSVSKGNLHRIRLALSYGARKLKKILRLPGECMGAAIERFFVNTLNRNGKGQRPDVEVPIPAFGTGRSEVSDLCGDCDRYYGGLQHVQLYHNHAVPLIAHTSYPSSPSHADMHALWTQQNWSMFYQMGTNIYVPGQPLYHPIAPQANYCLHDNVISQGTGTYIPDMAHNSYGDKHARVTRPRRSAPRNRNVLPKSPLRKEPVEVHSETDINDKSRSFEFSNEDFPVLPTIRKANPSEDMIGNSRSNKELPLIPSICQTGPSEAQEAVQLTGKSYLSQLNSELSNEEFPLLPSICKTSPSEPQGSVQLTKQAGNSSSSQLNIELSYEEFPPLPGIRKTSPSESQGSIQLTEQARNSSPSRLNIEVSNKNFPLLPRIRKTSASEVLESIQLTKQAGNPSSSQLNIELSNEEFPCLPSMRKTSVSEGQESILLTGQARNSSSSQLNIEFGTYSLPTKDAKEDCSVSSSGGTKLVVPRVAMEKKEEFTKSEEKR